MIEIRPAGGDTATPLNLRKRLDLIQRLAGPLTGKRVLDCGCGAGEYVRGLRIAGADAFGVEYEIAKLEPTPASRLSKMAGLAAGDIEGLPFSDARFDVALVNEVLEHVPSDRLGLREIHRVLKPEGVVVIFSPNRLFPFETHGVFLKRSGRRVPHYVPLIPYVPLWVGRRFLRYWARNYWPWELRRLVRTSGFELSSRCFVWQTFENISGRQPQLLGGATPLLRRLSDALERIPGVRCLGVSQMLVARRRAIEPDLGRRATPRLYDGSN